MPPPYNTPQQFRQFSFVSGSFDNIPDYVVTDALTTAGNEIDGALINHHPYLFTNGQTPSGWTVPAVVADAERVIAGYRLLMNMGIKPGAQSDFITRRYYEVYGTPDKPDSGLLGDWTFGRRMLISTPDIVDPTQTTSYQVAGTPPRGWYTTVNGREYIT